MGLDGVELVMEFEEAFEITMTDEEAANSLTPRMVIDLIYSKVKTTGRCICRSQRAFYIIRRTLVQGLGLDRRAVMPDSRIRDLIPELREKDMWEQMGATLAARDWPGLVRPRWMSRLLAAVGFAVFGFTMMAAIHLTRGRALGTTDCVDLVLSSALGGVVLAGLFGVVAAILTRPFCIYVPSYFNSIRDLIP